MPRFIVIIIDSYGCGAMDDILPERPQDQGAHTYLHVFEKNPKLKLPVLQNLGLGNASDTDEIYLKHNPNASYGTVLLQHWGADTFLGHQEILGTVPKHPVISPFSADINHIEKIMKAQGHKVRRFGDKLSILVVDESFTIGDNLETDPGQNINLTASFDAVPYEELKK